MSVHPEFKFEGKRGDVIKLLMTIFSHSRLPLPIHSVGFAAQGCKLVWANRNESVHPQAGAQFSALSSLPLLISTAYFSKEIADHVFTSSSSYLSEVTASVVLWLSTDSTLSYGYGTFFLNSSFCKIVGHSYSASIKYGLFLHQKLTAVALCSGLWVTVFLFVLFCVF